MCSKQNRRFKSNMIKEINESKNLTKHISCECKCKFDGRKCNSNQKWNNNKRRFKCRKHHIYKKGKYLASIIDDSLIMCDKIIHTETKIVITNFNEKKCSL